MDLGTLMSSLPMIVGMLPLIIQLTQVMFFIFFIWFFGSMSMKGFVARKPAFMGIAGTLLTGTLCLIASASFAGFIPFFDNMIFQFMNIDMIVMGIIISAILALALNMMTRTSAMKRPSVVIYELRRKVAGLEDMLRTRAHHLHAKDVEKIAEGVMKGYEVVHSKLVGNDYDVKMKKHKDEKKSARLIIDAWDGEVRQKITSESSIVRFFRSPTRLMGLLIILFIALGSAVFFEGFPVPGEEITDALGVDLDDVGDLASMIEDSPFLEEMPENCVSMLVFTQYYEQFQDSDFVLNHLFEDDQISRLIDENCGMTLYMVKIDHEGRDLIIGVAENSKVGYVTDTTFCSCIETLSR